MTRLCVAIFLTNADKARRDVALAAEAGAEMVELRIDRLDWSTTTEDKVKEWYDEIARVIRQSTVPCIVTLRSATEGGFSDLPDEARRKLVMGVADAAAGTALVDYEWAAVKRLGKTFERGKSELIVSSHDFSG